MDTTFQAPITRISGIGTNGGGVIINLSTTLLKCPAQKRIERDMFTLKMGKKVCEDWASLLLNEKTEIVIDDKSSSEFVQGAEEEQGTGGVLGDNKFWSKANALIEKSFLFRDWCFV